MELPDWFDVSPEDLAALDHKFWTDKPEQWMVDRRVVLQGPFILESSNPEITIPYSNWPAIFLRIEEGFTNRERLICYDHLDRGRQLECVGRVSIDHGVLRIPSKGLDVIVRRMEEQDLANLDLDQSTKKDMKSFLEAMRTAEVSAQEW